MLDDVEMRNRLLLGAAVAAGGLAAAVVALGAVVAFSGTGGAPSLPYGGLEGDGREDYPGFATRDLNSLYPPFRVRLEALIADMESRPRGYRIHIIGAWRDIVRQQFYSDSDWSGVDPSKGETGMHMAAAPDGTPESLAVDVMTLGLGRTDGPMESEHARFYRTLMERAPVHGLVTGGTYSRKAGNRWAKYNLGWDPGHIEPRGFSYAALKRGERPWT